MFSCVNKLAPYNPQLPDHIDSTGFYKKVRTSKTLVKF